MDPTVSCWKNVTPNCFRIEEILQLFRKVWKRLDELKLKIVQILDEFNPEMSQNSINSLLALKIEEVYGENVNLFLTLFDAKN